ncbi:MAG: sensor histidine kinase [Alphaproteobacteria bacterium]
MPAQSLERLTRRVERERSARKQAEALLEDKSRELYNANQSLQGAVDALEASASHMAAILDHTYAGIIVADEDGTISVINRAARAMFEIGEPEAGNSNVLDLIHADSRSGCATATAIEMDADEPNQTGVRHEAIGLRQSGETFPFEFAITQLNQSANRHRIWILQDLTQSRAAEEERAALEETLRQAQKLESLGSMAAGVAHEINTPVQYIGDNIRYLRDAFSDCIDLIGHYRALCETAADHQNSAKIIEQIKLAEDEADIDMLIEDLPDALAQADEGVGRVSKIVQAFKEFSHPGGRDAALIDVNRALNATIEVSRSEWKYVADLETHYLAEAPGIIGDAGEFNQVILNLIVNAAHAIEDHSPPAGGKISFTCRENGDNICIELSDNGCGMPADVQARIFDPFFTTKEVGKGSGQGLAISYQIITNNLNGSIEVASTPGEGTIFTLLIPKAK